MTKKIDDKGNIRFDWAMKRLLRDKANYVVLEGFIGELLKEDVTIKSIVDDNNPEQFNRVDITLETRNEETILVELQISDNEDFSYHILNNSHMLVGAKYKGMYRVFALYIVYSETVPGKGYIYHDEVEFRSIHDNSRMILSESEKKSLELSTRRLYPKFYIIKVNNFGDVIKTPLSEWVYYLKNSVIPENFTAKGLPEAREILKITSLTEEEYSSYIQYIETEE